MLMTMISAGPVPTNVNPLAKQLDADLVILLVVDPSFQAIDGRAGRIFTDTEIRRVCCD